MFLLAIPWEPALLTDVGVYYPIGPAFRGAELLIISEAQPQPRRGGRWRVWLWAASVTRRTLARRASLPPLHSPPGGQGHFGLRLVE